MEGLAVSPATQSIRANYHWCFNLHRGMRLASGGGLLDVLRLWGLPVTGWSQWQQCYDSLTVEVPPECTEFTAIVAEMLENAWRKCKIKLETTKTQRNQRRQRTDHRPRRRTDQRPSQDARRHSRLVSFFAHRGPSAPTPTSSRDGVNGCADMT